MAAAAVVARPFPPGRHRTNPLLLVPPLTWHSQRCSVSACTKQESADTQCPNTQTLTCASGQCGHSDRLPDETERTGTRTGTPTCSLSDRTRTHLRAAVDLLPLSVGRRLEKSEIDVSIKFIIAEIFKRLIRLALSSYDTLVIIKIPGSYHYFVPV